MANYNHRSNVKFVAIQALHTVASETARQSTSALIAQKPFLNGSKVNKVPFINALVIPVHII
jgi:hypothetical protein